MKTMTTTRRNQWALLLAALMMTVAVGCGDATGGGDSGAIQPPTPDVEPGTSDFISADGRNGEQSQDSRTDEDDAAEPEAGDAAADEGGEERTAEEGDIYRVLEDGRILNLNAFRGLQIIDVSDADNPVVEGRVQVAGHPVELYTVGDRAFVLMNNWRGYWRSVHDTRPETFEGGLIMVVDISDRERPRVMGQATISGWIRTSRLTRGGGQEALYVVANQWDRETYESSVVVKSFSVSDEGSIEARTELDLGGYVGDIQATGQRLMVSRVDYRNNGPVSRVSLIDISNPDGTMVEGDEVEVRGYVTNKYNMDVHGDMLRIVSGSTWGNGRTNHVQTFDASDIHNLEEIDHATFGDDMDLYATLFMGNKAFFVTYRRVDPFHAFEITDEGLIYEHSEYIISGWNNYFRPVYGGDRLIGIGVNDENSRTMAVSLYDTTDLANPEPFIARQEVAATSSWSEANWDDRAFSVLENAVEVEGPDGVTETGMVLLPFSGYNNDTHEYFSAVQIFTFSDTSLTQRGLMQHGTRVRRSFKSDDSTTANLSEAELSLFDHTNPNEPAERGRVELAPNYSDVIAFGDYAVRVKSRDYYYWWYRGQQDEPVYDHLEIIDLNEHPDTADAEAVITIPAGARFNKIGDHLVVSHMVTLPWTEEEMRQFEEDRQEYPQPRYETTLTVYDLSQPNRPRELSEMTTEQLRPSYNHHGYYYDDCWDCWHGYTPKADTHVIGDALVFATNTQHSLLLGREEVCNSYPRNNRSDCYGEDGPQACTYITGNRSCRTINDEPEYCIDNFSRCTQDDEGDTECEAIELAESQLRTHCYDYDRHRRWTSYEFSVLDLSDPSNPALGAPMAMAEDEESVGLLADGDDLYISYQIPVDVEDDPRPFVRHYFKRLNLADPSAPRLNEGINVPGRLLAVDGDGATIITMDTVWGEHIIEGAINKLSVRDGRAYLDDRHRMRDQTIQGVELDEQGNLLINHRNYDHYHWYHEDDMALQSLSVFSIATETLTLQAEVEVDRWASLSQVKNGRAVFEVPGGLLIMNLDDPTNPIAQAYYPARGWSRNITVHGDDIFFAAGRFGIYRFDLDAYNLNTIF